MRRNGNIACADTSVASCAYLAGIIDGEGYIGVVPNRGRKRPSYGLRISIASTSMAWLFDLRTRWGSIGSFHRRCPTPGRKLAATWLINGKVAQHVLSLTLPYLGIKREQALIALDFKIVGHQGQRSDREQEQAGTARAKLLVLNHRGTLPHTRSA